MSPEALLAPRDGVPAVVETPAALREAVDRLAGGDGPVAVDVERASGYRYSQRAYLVQLRRRAVGTVLVDPTRFPDLTALGAVIRDAEWVLHAASQDLPSLSALGLLPSRLFDTELAGRLAGYERVALGTLVAELLGWSLEKEHSAADWSRRPLPAEWLTYAALDVEVLVELRDALETELARQGKLAWAHEEFAALAEGAGVPAPPRPDPWRRTSGIHQLRRPRQLAGLRELWLMRDGIARDRDLAPGRVIPDSALVAAVKAWPASEAELSALPVWRGRATRRLAGPALAALRRAGALPDSALPAPTARTGDGPPPGNRWQDPVAAARLGQLRAAVAALAAEHGLPAENLLAPDAVRRLAWSPPPPRAADVAEQLRGAGARGWQVALTAGPLAAALQAPEQEDEDLQAAVDE